MSEDNGKSASDTLYERLKTDIDKADWELLAQHHEKGSVFMIKHELELLAVGFAMARDEVNYIKKWLTDEDVYQPTDEEIEIWKREDTRFNYLIIQPYVLVQVIKEDLQ